MPSKEIEFEIIESYGILSADMKKWTKELNLVSWNGAEPKYDIRDWAPGYTQMSKDVTLTKEEAHALYETLAMIFSDEKRNSKYKRERANELYSVNRKRIIKNAA